MLHDRLPIGSGRKRHRDHVDPHALVLKAMPADIDGSQFGDPPLLCRPDRLGRVAMLGVRTASHFNKHHGAAVEGHDIDVAAEHPLAAAQDPVPELLEMPGSLVLAPASELIAGRGHQGGLRQVLAAAAFFFALPLAAWPSAAAAVSSRFSRRRVALPERSRR